MNAQLNYSRMPGFGDFADMDGEARDAANERYAEDLADMKAQILTGKVFGRQWILAEVCNDFMETDLAARTLAAAIAGNGLDYLIADADFDAVLTSYATERLGAL